MSRQSVAVADQHAILAGHELVPSVIRLCIVMQPVTEKLGRSQADLPSPFLRGSSKPLA
jgi:hypothetical protein